MANPVFLEILADIAHHAATAKDLASLQQFIVGLIARRLNVTTGSASICSTP
jgi:hypothetical protein